MSSELSGITSSSSSNSVSLVFIFINLWYFASQYLIQFNLVQMLAEWTHLAGKHHLTNCKWLGEKHLKYGAKYCCRFPVGLAWIPFIGCRGLEEDYMGFESPLKLATLPDRAEVKVLTQSGPGDHTPDLDRLFWASTCILLDVKCVEHSGASAHMVEVGLGQNWWVAGTQTPYTQQPCYIGVKRSTLCICCSLMGTNEVEATERHTSVW